MLHALQNHMEQNWPTLFHSKIGLAISGGVDSVVLCHLCKQINLSVTLLHCNFQLRGLDSDEDQKFVKSLAEEYQFPFLTVNFDTKLYKDNNKMSTQLAARELRYQWFEKIASEHQLDYVLTAHHLNDSLETFLINLTRGTGLEGLLGIPQRNNIYLRPLLAFSKKQILEYAKTNCLPWREDESNKQTDYLRNKIRHHIIPELESISSNLEDNFLNTIAYLKQSQQVVKTYTAAKRAEIISKDSILDQYRISIAALNEENNYKLLLFEFLKPFNFTAWDDIYNLCNAQSGKKVNSSTHTLLKDREYLILYPIESNKDSEEIHINKSDSEVRLSNSEALCLAPSVENNSNTGISSLVLNIEKIKYPLLVRRWKEGDYFYPLGMMGKKKLSKYFKDEKMSLLQKKQIWVLCSGNDILWIINKRADRRFLAPKGSKGLCVSYKKQ